MSVSGLYLRFLDVLARWGWPLGCALLASIFLVSGGTKLISPQATAATTAAAGLPSSVWLVLAVGVFEIVVGGTLAAGYKRTWAALILLAYMLFVTITFHGFWRYEGGEREGQLVQA